MTDFDPDKLKHKPNEKHTLEEVLKSLQDLIHNDLLKGEAARLEEPPAPEPAPAIEETPEDADLPAAIPDITIPAADVPLGAVVQSLEELVNNDLALTDEPGQVPAAALPDPEPPAAPPPAPAAPTAPATGQQTFLFDDSGTAAPAEPEPIPTPVTMDEPELSPPVIESSDFDELAMDLAPSPGDFTGEAETATPEAVADEGGNATTKMAADDLPVLTDAVSEPVAPPIDDLPVLEEIALESPEDSPATIAARVVARLNAERRARGEAEFDDATLDALRALLREEIERNPPER